MRTQRENPRYLKGIKLLPGVEPVTDLPATLAACQLVFVALPSSALRKALQPVAAGLAGKLLVSTTKGIEAESFKLMSQILAEVAPQARIGVLSGPNLAREVAEHALTATVIASEDEELCQRVQCPAWPHFRCLCQPRPFWRGTREERLRHHRRHGRLLNWARTPRAC